MKLRQNDTLMALRRIQGFLYNYASALGSIPTCGVRNDLDASVIDLTRLAVAQKSSQSTAVGATSKLRELRRALIQGQMAPIAAIATARITRTPELAALDMPHRGIHSQALITAATAMGNTAAPFAATFIGQGLPVDFLTRLHDAASALQTAIDGRSAVKTSGVAATSGAAAQVRVARAVIKQLHAMVVPQLAGDATLLSAWMNTKTISAKHGVPATPAASTTPATSTSSTA